MLKESAVEKVMLCIFNSDTIAEVCVRLSVIFFKNKSRFRELQPVRRRVWSI